MSGLNGIIEFKTAEHRPCIVNEEKALFHRWEDTVENERIFTAGIVEYENGRVDEVLPHKIKFLDSAGLFHEIPFPEAEVK